MPKRPVNRITPKSRSEWRAWLKSNQQIVSEVWLVLHKGREAASTLTYNDAIEEAVCFGWIDGLRRTLDDKCYMHRMSPRKPGSRWSEHNKTRAQRMLEAGLMMPAGVQAIDQAKGNGNWSTPVRRPPALPMSAEFEAGLSKNKKAAAAFAALPPSHRRQYNDWIASAKREDTRASRIAEALRLLAAGRQLGMR
jgi:uncharacterized protein YdeI (YjbR/CyaY-like superfamily)